MNTLSSRRFLFFSFFFLSSVIMHVLFEIFGGILTYLEFWFWCRKYGLEDNTVDFIGHALALHRNDDYLDAPAMDTVKRMKVTLLIPPFIRVNNLVIDNRFLSSFYFFLNPRIEQYFPSSEHSQFILMAICSSIQRQRYPCLSLPANNFKKKKKDIHFCISVQNAAIFKYW